MKVWQRSVTKVAKRTNVASCFTSMGENVAFLCLRRACFSFHFLAFYNFGYSDQLWHFVFVVLLVRLMTTQIRFANPASQMRYLVTTDLADVLIWFAVERKHTISYG